MKKSINQLIYAAFFITFAVILPQVFHLLGSGSVFLPMHIPVLLSGFFLAWPYALMVGVLSPVLSFFLTGMPPVPMLFIMMFELATYGVLVSVFYNLIQKNQIVRVYSTLLIAMIGGRIVACLVTFLMATIVNMGKFTTFFAWISSSVIPGLPGILIQLVFIPAVIFSLSRFLQARKTV